MRAIASVSAVSSSRTWSAISGIFAECGRDCSDSVCCMTAAEGTGGYTELAANIPPRAAAQAARLGASGAALGRMRTMPDLAGERDIPSWLEIVSEVEPLFGPMPAFDGTLRRTIARSGAWCVRDDEGTVLAGLILSPPERSTIGWLAARRSARGRGHGRALVAHALREFATAREVIVDTFGDDNLEGRPARRLYESFGFVAAEELEHGPEGGTRQRFRLACAPERPHGSPDGAGH